MKQEKTSTYTDGQSPSPATPIPNGTYDVVNQPDARAYFLVVDGHMTLHIDMDLMQTVTVERMRRYYQTFLLLVLDLEDRGIKTIKTWIEEGNEKQRRVAKFFGFTETGEIKKISLIDGGVYIVEEMEFKNRGT